MNKKINMHEKFNFFQICRDEIPCVLPPESWYTVISWPDPSMFYCNNLKWPPPIRDYVIYVRPLRFFICHQGLRHWVLLHNQIWYWLFSCKDEWALNFDTFTLAWFKFFLTALWARKDNTRTTLCSSYEGTEANFLLEILSLKFSIS